MPDAPVCPDGGNRVRFLSIGGDPFATTDASGTAAQTVNIQAAPNTLTFKLRVVPGGAQITSFRVLVDTTAVLEIPAAVAQPYTAQSLTLPPLAPGPHTLTFSILCTPVIPGPVDCHRYDIDDVSLTTTGPDPIPPVAPDTQLTAAPKKKTNKKRARFELVSATAGATFECSLDRDPFAACVSPRTVKVGKGKHDFQVRAVAAGGTDATPATFTWKVKKRRK